MTRLPVETNAEFRLARLLLLLHVTRHAHPDGLDTERLASYDFLAAHPLLLASARDDPDRAELIFAGFEARALCYASPTQRFVTGQLRLRGDLAWLVAAQLAECTPASRIRYRATEAGHDLATEFTSVHAQAYTAAAGIVVTRLRRLSGRRLREEMRGWLATGTGPDRLDPAVIVDAVLGRTP